MSSRAAGGNPAGATKGTQVEVKLWNAVAVWKFGGETDAKCSICKNDNMMPCINCVGDTTATEECTRAVGKCGHVYHRHCIDKWLKDHTECPLCEVTWEYAMHEKRDEAKQGIPVTSTGA